MKKMDEASLAECILLVKAAFDDLEMWSVYHNDLRLDDIKDMQAKANDLLANMINDVMGNPIQKGGEKNDR